jgi:hypothetical protein
VILCRIFGSLFLGVRVQSFEYQTLNLVELGLYTYGKRLGIRLLPVILRIILRLKTSTETTVNPDFKSHTVGGLQSFEYRTLELVEQGLFTCGNVVAFAVSIYGSVVSCTAWYYLYQVQCYNEI